MKNSPKNQALKDMKECGISSYFLVKRKDILNQPKNTVRLKNL